MAKSRDTAPLADGLYRAKCKQDNLFHATANGHSRVWPECDLEIKKGGAYLSKNGKVVWDCSIGYAAFHFIITPRTK